MDILLNISPLVKLSAVFILIVSLIRLRLSIGTSLTSGAVIVGLWFHLSPFQVIASMTRSLIAQRTVTLCMIVSLILVLSHVMEKTGQMKRLLEAFRGISQNVRLNLALFPALIGLLPMPGGAIFSAPMVQEVSNTEGVPAERKTLINYWFRHIWEFSWPLYPGVILTCALSGIDLWTFILAQFPLTLVTAAIGYVTLLRTIQIDHSLPKISAHKRYRKFLVELTPMLIVVSGALILGAVAMVLGNIWPPLKEIKKEMFLILALAVSIWWVVKWNRLSFGMAWRLFSKKSLASMIFMIVGVMIFQGILNDSRAVSAISQRLTSAHVPITLVIVILPFLVGGIAGVTVAFVGTTFPIIFSLLTTSGLSGDILAYTILAFCSGYLGVLLSPLHICLILTCGFFKTDLSKIVLRLVPPAAVLGAAGLLSFWIHRIL